MYNWTTRLNAVATFGFMVLVAAAFASHATHYYFSGKPVDIKMVLNPSLVLCVPLPLALVLISLMIL